MFEFLDSETLDRFWSKTDLTGPCWVWKGVLNHSGYGFFKLNNKNIQTHRLSYQIYKGKIPQGLEIDHLCRNRSCVNPTHLEAVTHKENMIRAIRLKENNFNLKKTHCPKGHEYNQENLIKDTTRRGCKTCKKYWDNKRYCINRMLKNEFR